MPRAVREAGRAADEELAKLKEADAEQGSQEVPENTEAEAESPEPVEAEQSIPEQGVEESTGVDWAQEFKELTDRYQKLEHQFRVLQGKYNAEVPDLAAQLRVKEQELSDLQNRAPAPEQGANVDEQEQEIRDLYGDEFLQLVNRKTQQAVDEAVKPFQTRISEMDTDRQREAEGRFYSTLNEAHPDWQQINMTNEWLRFLGEVDDSSGLERQQIIDRAQQVGNPGPVIHQLAAFKQRSRPGKDRMRSQTVPAESGRSEAPKSEDQVVYKASDLRRFFKDVTDGKYRGKEDEVAQIERKFAIAHQEGRIDESA
jgi:hypothetical protein